MIAHSICVQYTTTEEFKAIEEYISSIITDRASSLCNKYPDYKIKTRANIGYLNTYHITNHNVPFFDMLCETLLHKDNAGYLEINEFLYQLNCFAKTIFHRKIWADAFDSTPDKFLQFVYTDWKQNQINNEFDVLEATALDLFKASTNLKDYHRDFIYNTQYEFVTLAELRELFDGLVEQGVWKAKDNDLYQVYNDVEIEQVNLDTKHKMQTGQISTIDKLHIRSKFKVDTVPKLKSIDSKFNFIPMNDGQELFEPLVAEIKFGNKIWFIPQYLVFYSNR